MKLDYQIKWGCTRTVFLTSRWAVKVPTLSGGWRLFLIGLSANMQERTFALAGWPEFCPVTFSIPGGWLIVMRRARQMTEDEFAAFDSIEWADHMPNYYVPCEHKADNFGWLDGRIVCIDYGN